MTQAGPAAKLFERIRLYLGRRGKAPGFKRLLISMVLGVFGALALAPYYILPGMVMGLCGLVFLLDGAAASKRPMWSAFVCGWGFGFGYFLAGMYWLGFAFLVQADQFAWMIPIAVPGLMGFLALFIALPVMAAMRFWRRGVARVLILVSLLSLFELIRGTILTGLPWNLFGQSFAGTAVLAQLAAYIGPYGLSLLVLLLATLPAGTIGTGKPPKWALLLVPFWGTALIALMGIARMPAAAPIAEDAPSVTIVQPSIAQRDKLDPQKRLDHFQQTVALSARALPRTGPSYLVWPENTLPYLSQTPEVPGFLADAFPDETIVLSGTIRRYPAPDGTTRFGNSFAVFARTVANPEGENPAGRATGLVGQKPLAAIYDKHHLVPFGEYLPLKGLLKAVGLSQLAPVEDGFTPGPGPRTLRVGPRPFAPAICYEDVFTREIYPRRVRPEWLVVVTNDAWFGDGAGPRQHLDISRLRAIESGLPMARAANTGISALIDPYGRVLESIPLYVQGTITHKLPDTAARPLYDRIGSIAFFALLLTTFTLGLTLALARSG